MATEPYKLQDILEVSQKISGKSTEYDDALVDLVAGLVGIEPYDREKKDAIRLVVLGDPET